MFYPVQVRSIWGLRSKLFAWVRRRMFCHLFRIINNIPASSILQCFIWIKDGQNYLTDIMMRENRFRSKWQNSHSMSRSPCFEFKAAFLKVFFSRANDRTWSIAWAFQCILFPSFYHLHTYIYRPGFLSGLRGFLYLFSWTKHSNWHEKHFKML